MVRGDAGPEANPILGNGGVIHWRYPKAAAAQFVAKPAHPVAIADDQRHNVSGGVAGIDPEPV